MKALAIPEALYHPVVKLNFLFHQRVKWFCVINLRVACVVDVRGLYQHLAGRAIAAGSQGRVRHTVLYIIMEDGQVVGVTVKNHVSERMDIRAAVTIDASGVSCYIGVRTDMGKAFHRYGYGAEYDLYAPNYPQDELFLSTGAPMLRVDVPGLFHVAMDVCAWASGCYILTVMRMHVCICSDIMHDLPLLRVHKFRGTPARVQYHTGLFPSEGPVERFSRDGLLLAGDAGGHG